MGAATIRDSSGAFVDHEELGNIWLQVTPYRDNSSGDWCYEAAQDV